jgi:hypothetical protein
MNQPINDGGPAFPHTTQWDGITPAINHNGMTLRDYFAAAALQAIISSALSEGTKTMYNIRKPDFLECLSLDAYAHADAMLKAREAKL